MFATVQEFWHWGGLDLRFGLLLQLRADHQPLNLASFSIQPRRRFRRGAIQRARVNQMRSADSLRSEDVRVPLQQIVVFRLVEDFAFQYAVVPMHNGEGFPAQSQFRKTAAAG